MRALIMIYVSRDRQTDNRIETTWSESNAIQSSQCLFIFRKIRIITIKIWNIKSQYET